MDSLDGEADRGRADGIVDDRRIVEEMRMETNSDDSGCDRAVADRVRPTPSTHHRHRYHHHHLVVLDSRPTTGALHPHHRPIGRRASYGTLVSESQKHDSLLMKLLLYNL